MYRAHIIGGLCAAFAISAPALSQDAAVADFYKGKTITWIIGTGEGGGYDLSSRLAGQYISRFIPDNPNVVPRNMPGAGSIAAAEFVFSNGPKDGTMLAMFQPTYILEKFTNPARRYKSEEFTYVARVDAADLVGLFWADAPAKTLEDAKKQEVILAANAAAGTSATIPWALNRLIGTKFKVVLGYNSSARMGLAMESGEAHGIGSTSWDYLQTKQDWFDGKKINILYSITMERMTALPNTPTVMELVSNERDRNALKLIASTSTVGRAVVAPPGNDAARTKALRAAFETMSRDPEYLADAKRRRLGHDFMHGEKLQALVADVAGQPQSVVDWMIEVTKKPD